MHAYVVRQQAFRGGHALTRVMPPEQLLWQLVKPLSNMTLLTSACRSVDTNTLQTPRGSLAVQLSAEEGCVDRSKSCTATLRTCSLCS